MKNTAGKNPSMRTMLKRYRFFAITIVALGILTAVNAEMGREAIDVVGFSFREMAMVIPPVFILLGLLDVWVPKETMVKYMGEGSGIKGVIIAFTLGSAAAGPLYGAFPVALVLMKKGATFSNILIFIGAWSTTKIPMFLFEMAALGSDFAVTRLLINIPGILIISFLLDKFVVTKERDNIYKLINEIED
ncbi:permease [Serpentinicella sp. ANB-PHB4]|uniref:permease n=1 Tax=Serpentinicella sp. ANB-PHB4 TaxID=3074076 RepID=UPI00285EDBD8|nr:permease [Serpentinicella sp. ANB-PHB4]MDR5658417.1 permease [Serpentinicella sp. ANB-PHB4]